MLVAFVFEILLLVKKFLLKSNVFVNGPNNSSMSTKYSCRLNLFSNLFLVVSFSIVFFSFGISGLIIGSLSFIYQWF